MPPCPCFLCLLKVLPSFCVTCKSFFGGVPYLSFAGLSVLCLLQALIALLSLEIPSLLLCLLQSLALLSPAGPSLLCLLQALIALLSLEVPSVLLCLLQALALLSPAGPSLLLSPASPLPLCVLSLPQRPL